MFVLELIKTVAAVAVPVVVAIVGYLLSHRLKLWEASQWRNQELIKARLQYYQRLAPLLNDLMCYLTFIGRWKELTPPEVIALKREADRLFHPVKPLFSERAAGAYADFIGACFQTHTGWGHDARIQSGYVRRRDASPASWDPDWNNLFAHAENETIPDEEQRTVRERYDELLRALAEDIELSEPRDRYVSTRVILGAR